MSSMRAMWRVERVQILGRCVNEVMGQLDCLATTKRETAGQGSNNIVLKRAYSSISAPGERTSLIEVL